MYYLSVLILHTRLRTIGQTLRIIESKVFASETFIFSNSKLVFNSYKIVSSLSFEVRISYITFLPINVTFLYMLHIYRSLVSSSCYLSSKSLNTKTMFFADKLYISCEYYFFLRLSIKSKEMSASYSGMSIPRTRTRFDLDSL